MYEPHRQQHTLLHEAYAQLLAETQCPLSGKRPLARDDQKSADAGERKSA